jgi:hypothetical protein
MPGVGCNVLNSFHMVSGVDVHKQIPPPPPAPAPHMVVYVMGLAMPATSKEAPTVKAGGGSALGRQHDLGMGPYHAAPNALLPLVWLAAGNKAEFGSGTVSVKTLSSGAAKMAVAVIPFAGINLQLDCNEPCPMPTSYCDASSNTVLAGFTAGDCVGGFAAMASDIAITYIVSKVAGFAKDLIGEGLAALLGALGDGVPLLVVGLAGAAFPTTAAYVSMGTEMVIGWMVGTPLGWSPSWAPGSNYGGKLNQLLNDTFSSAPGP